MMRLREAIEAVRRNAARTELPVQVVLACGFTASSLQTLLTAELSHLIPDRRIDCAIGPYGDVVAGLVAAAEGTAEHVVAIVEWTDVDARLGYRRLGGWNSVAQEDLIGSADARLAEIEQHIKVVAKTRHVVVMAPTLPLPPVFPMSGDEAGAGEWRLRAMVAGMFARCAAAGRVRVIAPEAIDVLSPAHGRHDIRGDLAFDMPYAVDHAAAVAGLVARLIRPTRPLKGIITDLDDTLWGGLVGEVGLDGVSWDLDAGTQMHGVYQQMLAAIAERGMLVSLASKNDPALVTTALSRSDLRIAGDLFYPMEVGWHGKAESVARILARWNVDADSVVFVDDSPIELAEVGERFPAMTCLRFPTGDEVAILALVRTLRDLFATRAPVREDMLRARSIRNGAAAEVEERTAPSRDAFLSSLEGRLTLDVRRGANGDRLVQLVNKTNQFNLNGHRLDEGAWQDHLSDRRGFSMVCSYTDRFGDLGRIAAVLGRMTPAGAMVTHWVMSCRAFRRNIEFQVLVSLLEALDVDHATLQFQATSRNEPFRLFLAALGVGNGEQPVVAREMLPDGLHMPRVARVDK